MHINTEIRNHHSAAELAASGHRPSTGPTPGRGHRTSPVVAMLAMLTGLVLLAACGGGGSGDSNGSGSSGSGSSGGSAQNDPAKFSQCMRSHGVSSFPDPDSSGHFQLRITKGGALDPNSATFKAAVQSCRKYDTTFGSNSGNSGPSSQALAFAKCMRSHGVTDFPDPKGNGLRITGDVRSNPHFSSAQQACRHLLSGNGSALNGGGQ